jgi:hypothetical protein
MSTGACADGQASSETDEEVEDAFIESWTELPLDLFTPLAQSMPDRLQAVVDANGEATKY